MVCVSNLSIQIFGLGSMQICLSNKVHCSCNWWWSWRYYRNTCWIWSFEKHQTKGIIPLHVLLILLNNLSVLLQSFEWWYVITKHSTRCCTTAIMFSPPLLLFFLSFFRLFAKKKVFIGILKLVDALIWLSFFVSSIAGLLVLYEAKFRTWFVTYLFREFFTGLLSHHRG